MTEKYWTVDKAKRMIDKMVRIKRRECIDLPDGTYRVLPAEVGNFVDEFVRDVILDRTLFVTEERAELVAYYLEKLDKTPF